MRMVLDDVGVGGHDDESGFAYVPAGYGRGHAYEPVVVTSHSAPVEGDAVGRDDIPDPVGLLQRRAQPLLRVDALHAVLGGKYDRSGSVDRGRGHADDVWLLLLDHLTVIEIGIAYTKALAEPFQPLLAPVRCGHHLGLIDGGIGAEVPVWAGIGVARDLVLDQAAHSTRTNNRDLVLGCHVHSSRGRDWQHSSRRLGRGANPMSLTL